MVLSLLALLVSVTAQSDGCSSRDSSTTSVVTKSSLTSTFSTILAPPTAECGSSEGNLVHEREFTFKYLSNTKDWIKVDVYINSGEEPFDGKASSGYDGSSFLSAQQGSGFPKDDSSSNASYSSAGPSRFLESKPSYTFDSSSESESHDDSSNESSGPWASEGLWNEEKTLSFPLLVSTQELSIPVATSAAFTPTVTTSSEYTFDYFTLPLPTSTDQAPTWIPCSSKLLRPTTPVEAPSLNILHPIN